MTTTKAKEFNKTTHETECHCMHELTSTGGVFYQSVGLIYCVVCGGWQAIRKPLT